MVVLRLKIFWWERIFLLPEANKFNKNTIWFSKTEDKDIYLDFCWLWNHSSWYSELNIEDGRKRNFICVQLDEETDKKKQAYKEGYKSIFNITKDRIIKAGKKLKKDNPNYNGDLGFKIFETVHDFRAKMSLNLRFLILVSLTMLY